jgi:hypothetical protein
MGAVIDMVSVLGGGGVLATACSVVSTWAAERRRGRDKRPTLRITQSDGTTIFLDANAVQELDAEKLKVILAELLPAEVEEQLDVDGDDEEKDSDTDKSD